MVLRNTIAGCAWLCACGPSVAVPIDETGSGNASDGSGTTALTTSAATTTTTFDPDDSDEGIIDDFWSGGETGSCPGVGRSCARPLDVVVVVDNSATMGEEQLALARAMPELVQQLYALMDAGLVTDVHVMFTTTDMGNPYCEPFNPAGYVPAQGAPTATGCNARIDDFTGLDPTNPLMIPEACTSACPVDLVPGDDFVAFDLGAANVLDVPPVDIDGDGVEDPPVAQALACLAPQGINGCGYEAPLEAMMQALYPNAAWNQGDGPFYRPEAALAIAIVTDETDCSLADHTILTDQAYMAVNPDTGTQQTSGAACWNAGVECMGPDAQGVYSRCVTIENYGIQPLSRYTQYLRDELLLNQAKPVYMLALVGVPAVTEHSARPPYEPVAGGLFDLVYRDWRDPQYPVGDILPDEWNEGAMASDKQFDFGMGPACTGEDGMGGFTGQAIPSPRVVGVCQSLDGARATIACCVESACDQGYETALRCLTGLVEAG